MKINSTYSNADFTTDIEIITYLLNMKVVEKKHHVFCGIRTRTLHRIDILTLLN